jgi:branched-chain amino acid transport system substrate-binding protein
MSVKKFSLLLSASLLFSPPVFAQIKIGVAGPMSGTDKELGMQLKNGAELAASDINAAGGVLGQKIELSFGDDKSNPSEGIKIANKFSSENIKFVVGHYNSGVSIPASEIYAENNILMMSPSSTNPQLTERGLWNSFRTCGRDDMQGIVAAEYIAKNFPNKKIAIAHDKTVYGKGLADETRKALSAKGIKDTLYEGINIGEKSYSALLLKIKESGAEIIYWGGLHPEAVVMIKEMREQGSKTVFIGGDGMVSDEFATIGGNSIIGTLMTLPSDPKLRPEAKSIIEKFKAKSINAELYVFYSYAAVQIMAETARRINSLDPKKIAIEMRNGKSYDTAIGKIAFDLKGDVKRLDYIMHTWKKVGDRIIPVQN